MSNYQSSEWKKLCEYGSWLVDVQRKAFKQIEAGTISDGFATGKPDEVMARVYALESIFLSLGMIKEVGRELAKPEVGYPRLDDQLASDRNLLALSSFRGDTPRRLREAYQKFALEIVTFAEKMGKTNAKPAPYAGFFDFDMEVWVLTCLLDIKDVYFGDDPVDKAIAGQRELVGRIDAVIADRIDAFRRAQSEDISDLGLVGWYGSVGTMSDLQQKSAISALAQSEGGRLALTRMRKKDSKATNQTLFRSVLTRPEVIDTTLLSTRAVCTFVVVGKEIYDKIPAVEEVEKASKSFALEAFEDFERKRMESEEFGHFCLAQLKRFAASPLTLENIDGYVHLCGILSFALSRGYFFADSDGEKLREELSGFGFATRTDIINSMVTKLRQEGKKLLLDASQQENYFVATADLRLLLNDDGTDRDLKDPAQRERIEPRLDGASEVANDQRRHTFVYLVVLPIAVKALAQLATEERRRISKVAHDKWSEVTFPPWIEDVEKLGDDLVEQMIKQSLRRSETGEAFGEWKGEHDWSVTAAIVEALNVWCVALAYRTAWKESQQVEPARQIIDGDRPGLSSDQEAFERFLTVLQRHATAPQGNGGASVGQGLQYLPIVDALMVSCLGYYPHDTGMNRTSLGIEMLFKIAMYVQHKSKQTPLQLVIDIAKKKIDAEMRKVKTEIVDPETRFADICKQIDVECRIPAPEGERLAQSSETRH